MSYQPTSGLVLVMRRGPRPALVFPSNKASIPIGRSPGNDLVVDAGTSFLVALYQVVLQGG